MTKPKGAKARVPPAAGGARWRAAAPDPKLFKRLNSNILRLAQRIESANLAELVHLHRRPWRLMWSHFLVGLARGVGLFVGGGVIGAVTLGLLTWLVYHLLKVADMIPLLNQLSALASKEIAQFLQQHQITK